MNDFTGNMKPEERIEYLEKCILELKKINSFDLLENTNIGFIQTDYITGKVIYANSVVVKLTGYSGLEEMVKDYSIMDSYTEPAGRQKMLNLLQEKGILENYELSIYDRNGKKRTLLYSANLDKLSNIINGVIVDITNRKNTEIIVKESEEKYRLLFDHMSSGFVLSELIMDEHGKASDFRILEVNDTFKEIVNLQNDIKNKTVRELNLSIKEDMILQLANIGITGKSFTIERYSRRTDKYFRIHVYSPKPAQIAVILDDITLQKKAENELKQQKEELEMQAGKLAELNATKDKFFAIISHDLRNPFNTILNLCTLLKLNLKNYPAEETEKLIDLLNDSASKGFSLLENLLNWSRSQTSQLHISPKSFNISVKVDLNVDLLRQAAKEKKIDLFSTIDRKMFVFADEDMINTVIRNLISNAIKYTYEKGKVTISAKEKKQFIELAVRDTGTGIDPENMENLFRIDVINIMPGTKNEKGTGLGLIICKEFIQKNGGSIWVESKPKKGSIFYITIPKAETKAST